MNSPLECKSELGITVGLIDSIMTVATVVADRLQRIHNLDVEDYMPEEIIEACSDLFQDKHLRFLVAFGGNREYEDSPMTIEFRKMKQELKTSLPDYVVMVP